MATQGKQWKHLHPVPFFIILLPHPLSGGVARRACPVLDTGTGVGFPKYDSPVHRLSLS